MLRRLGLVIFDCDGVLVDSEPISCRVMAKALTEIGLPYTTEECMRDYMGRAWEDSLRMIEERLGAPVPDGFTESFRSRRDAALREEVRPVAGVREAIERIELDRCVASSGLPEKIRLTLGTTGLLELFAEDRLFSAVEVERGKPAPDLFLHAAATLREEPSECVVVEDTAIGAAAARAAGMTALGYADNVSAKDLAAAGAVPFGAMDELPELVAAHAP